jgi:hypothetical protein
VAHRNHHSPVQCHFFVIHIRATGVWCAMAIVLALLTLSLLSAKTLKQQSDSWVSITARSVAGYWPALIALVVTFAGMKVVSMSLHPIYREEGWSSHHVIWFAHASYSRSSILWHGTRRTTTVQWLAMIASLLGPRKSTKNYYRRSAPKLLQFDFLG